MSWILGTDAPGRAAVGGARDRLRAYYWPRSGGRVGFSVTWRPGTRIVVLFLGGRPRGGVEGSV